MVFLSAMPKLLFVKLKSLKIRRKLSSPAHVIFEPPLQFINASAMEKITGISVKTTKPMKFGARKE